MILIAFFTDFFYNVIISWALYYLFASFSSKLPWTECGDWSTEQCFSGHMHGETFPVCTQKARTLICSSWDQFNTYKQCIDSGYNGSMCGVTDFTYPILARSEAVISNIRPNISNMFSDSNYLYNNITEMVTLSAADQDSYCSWQANATSPAAEYFQ